MGNTDWSFGYVSDTAGIAGYLAEVFNSSIQLYYNDDYHEYFYEVHGKGLFAQQQLAHGFEFFQRVRHHDAVHGQFRQTSANSC